MGGQLPTLSMLLYGLLAGLTLVTILVSVQPSVAVRQNRNLTILASYAVGVALLFADGWVRPAAVWAAVGLLSGLLYYGYDVWSISRARQEEPNEDHGQASASMIALGVFAWPVALPEVIEYVLADLGAIGSEDCAAPDDAESQHSDSNPGDQGSGGDA